MATGNFHFFINDCSIVGLVPQIIKLHICNKYEMILYYSSDIYPDIWPSQLFMIVLIITVLVVLPSQVLFKLDQKDYIKEFN